MQQYKKILGKVMMTAEGAYNSNKGYDPISLVTDEETGKSYISRQEVPVGTQINNREYWQPIASSGIIDNGVIILNRKNSDGQVPIYDLKSATEAVAIGDRKGGVILGFLGFNPETDTAPTWKLYQYNDVSPSNWTNIDYWLPMDYTNKYAGWFDNELALYDSVPFPKVGMYAYVGNSVLNAVIYRCYKDRVWQPTEDKAFSGVVNLADEEDITSKQNKLKFKDKEYNPAQFSGLGKLYLRKNIIDGKNILMQDMMQATNTIYIIQYDYDLQGAEITIPENCILDFQGGSFSNGTIVGNNTCIIAGHKETLFKSIEIIGDWIVQDIYVNWMYIDYGLDSKKEIKNIFNLTNNKIDNTVYFESKSYFFKPISNSNFDDRCYASVKSNTTIVIPVGGSINVLPNSSTNYMVFYCGGVENVKICGGGSIHGDVGEHTYLEDDTTNAQNCVLINFYRVKNSNIENLTLTKSVGDALYLGGNEPSSINNYSSGNTNVIINNVICDSNRRQGLSVTGATQNLMILNSQFINTGIIESHSPSSGIDFEPNYLNTSIDNVLVDNCKFIGNKGGQIVFMNINSKNFNINNSYIESGSTLDGIKLYEYGINFDFLGDFTCNINNSKILGTLHGVNKSSKIANIYINNCDIKGVSTYGTAILDGKTHNANFIFENCRYDLDNENVLAGGEKASFVFKNSSVHVYFKNSSFKWGNVTDTVFVNNIGYTKSIFSAENCIIDFNETNFPNFQRLINCVVKSKFAYVNPSRYKENSLEYINNIFNIETDTDAQFGLSIINSEENPTIKINDNIFKSNKIPYYAITLFYPDRLINYNVELINNKFEDGVKSYERLKRKFNKSNTNSLIIDCPISISDLFVNGLKSDALIPKKIGFPIFETSLNKPIWWNGANWVDATGTEV